ncbi:MAG: hypothetical protein A4E65_02855 [Syntrophorhabdus sp. PtaU1.Bin153]|nr:MAG: hypothetical protein A4E65_02855 [Syntrophorhabdus sp. PtaU1.Bin153]
MKMNRLSTSFFPNSHKRIGEFGLGGYRYRSDVSDVDEMRVLADRRLDLHRSNRFAGHPRAAAIGKEQPAMAWVVSVEGRTVKQITGHPLVGHGHRKCAGNRP